VYASFHETKASNELLSSKADFESFAARYNVKIKAIRADNGVYAAKCFRDSCLKQQQDLSFCAVCAHWQNGIAERFIGTITEKACTILLHAMQKWPTMITEDMWPYAVRHAINFHNASIHKDATNTPHALFTGEDPPTKLGDFRVFGCPTYVLDKHLQDGSKINKWKPRSWQGIYIGTSSCHASHIPLILNPRTTHITPQYHVIYDEHFYTTTKDTPDDHPYLDRLYNSTARWLYSDPYTDTPYTFDSYWKTSSSPSEFPCAPSAPAESPSKSVPIQTPAPHSHYNHHMTLCPRKASVQPEPRPRLAVNSRGRDQPSAKPDMTSRGSNQPSTDYDPILRGSDRPSSDPDHALQRSDNPSPDKDKPLDVFGDCKVSRGSDCPSDPIDNQGTLRKDDPSSTALFDTRPAKRARSQNTNSDTALRPQYPRQYPKNTVPDIDAYVCTLANSPNGAMTLSVDETLLDPVLFHAPTTPGSVFPANSPATHPASTAVDSKADTLTQSQMLKQPDVADFLKAQLPELQGLVKMDVFDLLPIAQKPSHARLLSSIWSYRRKRNPIGDIIKWKARLCVDGSQQLHGRDYWETYAPVVSWASVRLLLLLSTILNLKSRQVDYTQAFPQAVLDDPVYMRLPQGFYVAPDNTLQQHSDPTYHDRSHFIKLKRNLYGCKQAARNWFAHLNKGLIAMGFTPSKVDPCLYCRHDCILAVYTDDCLIFARQDSTIDELIASLSEIFLLQDQGNIQDYLGIRVTKDNATKTITMQQPSLIESILQDLN